VLDDGYDDEAVTKLNGHTPTGKLRGGKYSNFDAGTRVPLIVSWPGNVKPGKANALVSQLDFFASFSSMLNIPLADDDAPDSFNELETLLGMSNVNRDHVIEHSSRGLSIVKGNWKYIESNNGPKMSNKWVNIELGNDSVAQLYNISTDIGETKNLATGHPEKLNELKNLLGVIKKNGRSR
jgi:arylsulfatase A-like enzyme